jgi:restriction system protein
MWKRLLAGIFGVVSLVVWKKLVGERTKARKAATEELAKMLRNRLNSMSGQEFEWYMAEVFRKMGHKVDIVGGPGDQGVDLLLKVGRKRVAVQCKLHSKPVGRAAVSEVYAGARYHGAKHAWLVAPGGFTPAAKELAEGTNVQLLDLATLRKLLHKD